MASQPGSKILSPLEEITQTLAWVVGPLYDKVEPKRSIGYRAVKGWRILSLGDDNAEEAVTIRAETPDQLLEKVREFEADAARKLAEALEKK